MRKIAITSVFVLLCSTLLVAQSGDRERPEPNFDELIAFLGLTDSQLDCLGSNKDALRDALAPSRQQLRDLQQQLRQAARAGEDTAAIQAQIDAVQAAAEATRSSFAPSNQDCLTSDQIALVGELAAAQTLAQEIRQAIGLGLLQSSRGMAGGPSRGSRRGQRGSGRGRR